MLILAQLLNPCFKSTWLSFPVGDPEGPQAARDLRSTFQLSVDAVGHSLQQKVESAQLHAFNFQKLDCLLSHFHLEKNILNYIVKWVMHQNNASFLRKGLSVLGV